MRIILKKNLNSLQNGVSLVPGLAWCIEYKLQSVILQGAQRLPSYDVSLCIVLDKHYHGSCRVGKSEGEVYAREL